MTAGFIVYIIWLIIAALLFLLVNSIGTLIILAVSAVVPPLLIMLTAIASLKVKIGISSASTDKKGEPLDGFVSVINGSIIPLASLKFSICCKNFLNGETDVFSSACAVAAKSECHVPFDFSSQFAGRISVFAENVYLYAPAGIFRFKIKTDGTETYHLIMPETAPCLIAVADETFSQADGEKYSMTKAGNDPSETFLIREYVPGDPIKNIHWKLTEKVDKTMVRELGLPIKNDILLLFDMSYDKSEKKPSREYIDTAAEIFASISKGLVEGGYEFTLGYCDNSTQIFGYREITIPPERDSMLEWLMSNTFCESDVPFVNRYAENKPFGIFQHVILITLNENNRLDILAGGNRVCALMPGEEQGNKIADGLDVISFTDKNYKDIIETLGI